jgi:hypothetical protein
MTITSSDQATLSAQLSQLSEEELRALLSNRASASAIASTPVVISSTSVHARASQRPLPNSSAGGSLLAMASSRRQSAITKHLCRDVHAHRATPRGVPSRRATITPGHSTVFRSHPPNPDDDSLRRSVPLPVSATNPAGLPRRVSGPVSHTSPSGSAIGRYRPEHGSGYSLPR